MNYAACTTLCIVLLCTTALAQNQFAPVDADRGPSDAIAVDYQGFLTDPAGTPISDVLPMTFRLIKPSMAFAWTETHPAVVVDKGLFNVRLGSISPLNTALAYNDELNFEVEINSELLSPSQPLGATARAINVVTPLTLVEESAFSTLSVINDGGMAIVAQQTSSSGLDPAVEAIALGRGPGVRGTNSAHLGIGVEGRLLADRGVAIRAIAEPIDGSGVALAGITNSSTGRSGVFLGGEGVEVTAAAGAPADLMLGATGFSGADDNGVLSTDPSRTESDLILVSYDRVAVHLDEDGNQTDAHFVVVNSADAHVFRVDEAGNVYAGTTLVHTSDATRKRNAQPVDPDAVLEGVARLPIERWQYDNDDAYHLGPMAQDFSAAFGLGVNDRTIATVDGDGVALAAIQALHRRVEELTAQLEALHRQLAADQTPGDP